MPQYHWRVLGFPLLLLAACSDPASDTPAMPGSSGQATGLLDGVRFATFNASLNRAATGQLVADLTSFGTTTPGTTQAKNAAETIQRIRPDVVLINEFDFYPNAQAARLFQQNYLSQTINGSEPIEYPYFYVAESNTGIASLFDLNNNGSVGTTPGDFGYGDDAFGFGAFPGQFGMVVYSKYPILEGEARTFQRFLWKDMPGTLLPDDPATATPADWYSPAELAVFRLSSKSHWDLPLEIGGKVVHFLVSHPTPPVFDGAEDRNGTRNFDEIRFWADYIHPDRSKYIYDDAGRRGGLEPGGLFVIAGLLSKYGLVEEVLQHARQSLDQLDPAVEHSAEGRRVHIGASASLEVVADEVVRLVRILDGFNRVRFGSDPSLLAGWIATTNIIGPPVSVGQSVRRSDGSTTPTGTTAPAGEAKPAA